MKSLATLLAAVWLTGCAAHRPKPPPLPPAPAPVTGGAPAPPPPAVVYVKWDFQLGDTNSTYHDVLEIGITVKGPWSDVDGPYSLDSEATSYVVPVPGTLPSSFFRVRRVRGTPNVN